MQTIGHSSFDIIAALKFCFKTCIAMKFVDDDDDDDDDDSLCCCELGYQYHCS